MEVRIKKLTNYELEHIQFPSHPQLFAGRDELEVRVPTWLPCKWR